MNSLPGAAWAVKQNERTTAPPGGDPRISAIIPTYNREILVERAVASALRQTYPPREVIVVDDGSTDDTRKRLEAFGDLIRPLYQRNRGSATARNSGIAAATSPWVALLDSDDVWTEDHLERMRVAIHTTGGSANYYFADTLQPPERGGGSLWAALGFEIEDTFSLRHDGSEWALMGIQPMMLQSTVFNRNAFLAAGGFLPTLRYRDDTHMFLRLGLEQPICAVRGYGAQMSADDSPDNRLTYSYNKSERGYAMQVVMNQDLLLSLPDLRQEHRELLKNRLASANWALARLAWLERRLVDFLRYTVRTARVRPSIVARPIARGLTRQQDNADGAPVREANF